MSATSIAVLLLAALSQHVQAQDGTLTAGQLTEMAKASVSETQSQIAALCLKEDDNSITTSGDPNERQQLLALKQAYYEGVVTYLTANKGMVVAEGQAAVDSSIAHYNTLKEEVAAAAEAGEDLCPY